MKSRGIPEFIMQHRFLWFITLTYTMVIMIANWFDPRLVNIFGFTTDAGTLIFPLTFILSDLITEVYGYKHARRAIWCGFLFNMVFIFYGLLVTHLPSPDYPTQNEAFDKLLASNVRIIIASCISYLSAEPLNSLIMAKLKIKMRGRQMGFRFAASTLIASGADSCIFGVLAFYGVMSNMDLFYLIATMWAIKSGIEILGLPVSIRLAKRLKKLERLDIYDEGTDFNLFNLDVNYGVKDNAY